MSELNVENIEELFNKLIEMLRDLSAEDLMELIASSDLLFDDPDDSSKTIWNDDKETICPNCGSVFTAQD